MPEGYLPKNIFYVMVGRGLGDPLAYRQRGGKIFTSLQHAQNHKAHLERQGVVAKIYGVRRVEWEELVA